MEDVVEGVMAGLTPLQRLKLSLLGMKDKILAETTTVDEILRLLEARLPSEWKKGMELLLPGGPLHAMIGWPPEWFTNVTVGLQRYDLDHQPCHGCLTSEGQSQAAVDAKLCAGCRYSCYHKECQAGGWPRHKLLCKLLRKNPGLAAALRRLQKESGVYTDGSRWYAIPGRHSDEVHELVNNWLIAKAFELEHAKMGKPSPVEVGPCPVSKKEVFHVMWERHKLRKKLGGSEDPCVGLEQMDVDVHSTRSSFYLPHPETMKPLVDFLEAKGCVRYNYPAAGKGLLGLCLHYFGGVPAEAIRCTDLTPEPGYFPVDEADACDPKLLEVDWETTVLVLVWLEFPGMPPYAERLIRLAHKMGVKHILLGAEEQGCAMSPKAHEAMNELYPTEEEIPGVPDFRVCHLSLANLIFISGDQSEHVRHIPLAYAADPSFRSIGQSLRYRTLRK